MHRFAILRTTLVLSIADAITLIASAVASIMIGRWYGPELLGIYSFAVTLGMLVQVIADGGYSLWLPREVARIPQQIGYLLNAALAVKVGLWLVCLFPALVLAASQGERALVLSVLVLLSTLAKVLCFAILAALRGIEQYVRPQLISAMYSMCGTLIMLGTLSTGMDLSIAVGLSLAADIAALFHMTLTVKKRSATRLAWKSICSHFRWKVLISHLSKQRQLWLINIASSIIHRAPLLVLGVRGSATELGYFSAAYRLYSALRILPGSLFNAVLPRLTTTSDRRNIEYWLLASSTGVAIATAGLLCYAAEELIQWTFGFYGAVVPLQLLAWAFAGLFVKTTFEVIFIGRGLDRKASSIVVGGACLLMLIIWLFTPSATSFSILTLIIEWALCFSFAIIYVAVRR